MTEYLETHCQICRNKYENFPKKYLVYDGTGGNLETFNYYYTNSLDDKLMYTNSTFPTDGSMFKSIEKLDYDHFCEFCHYDLMKDGKIFYYGTVTDEVYFDVERKFRTKECSKIEPLANAILGKSG